MTLIETITSYYKDNFHLLPDDKKFHFATRMSAWYDDLFANEYLKEVKPTYVKDPSQVKNDLKDLLLNPPAAKINAAETRQPFFDKYPDLRGLMLALFRVRHLLTVYGEDFRGELAALYPVEKMYTLVDALMNDTPALKVLSTYAINTIYLVDDVLYPSTSRGVQVETFAAIGKTSATETAEDIQLLIYFYTHCIIGASNFYTRHLSEKDLETYRDMVQHLEGIVQKNITNINLDNKFELLVCAQIVGISLSITESVYREATQSISPEGSFVIDTLNSFKQSNKTSFADSEHRNVLLILSAQNYSPRELK